MSSQNERSHFRAPDSLLLGDTISNALISGYDNPVMLASLLVLVGQGNVRYFFSVDVTSAIATAREVASYLRERHGATRVLLFGSLARGKYRSGSDIDIYFEGVPPEKAGAATGLAMVAFPNAPLDLWPDDRCASFFKSEALATGKPL